MVTKLFRNELLYVVVKDRVSVQLELHRIRKDVRVDIRTSGTVLGVLVIGKTGPGDALFHAALILSHWVTARKTEVLLVFAYYKAHVRRVQGTSVILLLARREIVVLIHRPALLFVSIDRDRLLIPLTQAAVTLARLQLLV